MPEHPAPVTVDDRLLLAYELTAVRDPTWAAVDFVDYLPAEGTPNDAERVFPWTVGYRITMIHAEGYVTEQLGLVRLDDDGRDSVGSVLLIDPQRRP